MRQAANEHTPFFVGSSTRCFFRAVTRVCCYVHTILTPQAQGLNVAMRAQALLHSSARLLKLMTLPPTLMPTRIQTRLPRYNWPLGAAKYYTNI